MRHKGEEVGVRKGEESEREERRGRGMGRGGEQGEGGLERGVGAAEGRTERTMEGSRKAHEEGRAQDLCPLSGVSWWQAREGEAHAAQWGLLLRGSGVLTWGGC